MSKPAKIASAGVVLALAFALLALGGCGGGSSSDSTSTSTSASAAGANGTAEAAEGGAENGASGTGGASAGTAGEAGVNGSAASGGGSSSGGKHGPRVPQPKGAPEPKITPKQRREATVADMILKAPAIPPASTGPAALPAQYTCDGKNTSPALRWGGVPQGTKELALFAMNVQPVNGKLFFDWAVGGLDPELGEIEAGKLPKGTVVGRNSFGKNAYEICPQGGGEIYMFALYALPKKLSPGQGFEPLAFRKAVSDVSHNAGLMALAYSRR